MLINEVLDSKSIALSATENASNQIPYLGLQWFPERKKQGLDLSWIKTHKGLPVSLAPSNFGTIPTIRVREGLSKEKTQMAFFREGMTVGEEEMFEIERIQSADDPYLASALSSVYDDTNNLVSGAEVVPERMRMSLLATSVGRPVIAIVSDGVQYAYDYDKDGSYTKDHYAKLSGTSMWSDTANSKPLTDLNNARKKLQKQGKIARYVLMNSNTFQYLLDNAQIRNSILAQNLTATIDVDDDTVISVVQKRTKLTIVLYDKMYIDDDGKEQYFYPDNKVTLLPEGSLGSTWFGTTPEERTARQVADVDVTVYGVGITVATKTEYGPPMKMSTFASEVVLPSYENMDSTFVYEVHGEGVGGTTTKYPYIVVHNGKWYNAGEEVLGDNNSGASFDYSKTTINRMSTSDLQAFATEQGIDNAEELPGAELKKLLIEKFGL